MAVDGPLDYVCLSESSDACWKNISPDTICSASTNGIIFSGDSGGPLLLDRDGVTHVAAVAAHVDVDSAAFGCSTIVSAYAGWIAETMGGDGLAGGSACIRASHCRSGVCSLDVCCDKECLDAPPPHAVRLEAGLRTATGHAARRRRHATTATDAP